MNDVKWRSICLGFASPDAWYWDGGRQLSFQNLRMSRQWNILQVYEFRAVSNGVWQEALFTVPNKRWDGCLAECVGVWWLFMRAKPWHWASEVEAKTSHHTSAWPRTWNRWWRLSVEQRLKSTYTQSHRGTTILIGLVVEPWPLNKEQLLLSNQFKRKPVYLLLVTRRKKRWRKEGKGLTFLFSLKF